MPVDGVSGGLGSVETDLLRSLDTGRDLRLPFSTTPCRRVRGFGTGDLKNTRYQGVSDKTMISK